MRISEAESLVLNILDSSVSLEHWEIARRAKLKEHQVRYLLSKLRGRGVYRGHHRISSLSAGLRELSLRVRFSGDADRDERKRLIANLLGRSQVSSLWRAAGSCDLGMIISAINPHRAYQECIDQYHDSLSLVELAERSERIQFSRGYLEQDQSRSMQRVTAGEQARLDEKDRKILSGLALYPDASRRVVARKIKIPQSTFELRLERLEEEQIYRGKGVVIDGAKLGVDMFQLYVSVRVPSQGVRQCLEDFCSRTPHVISLAHSTGTWQAEVCVEVDSPRRLTEISAELNSLQDQNIRVREIDAVSGLHKYEQFNFEH